MTRTINPTTAAVRQYSRSVVFAVWAAAALPMVLLAWVVAPAVAGPNPTVERFTVALIGALTVGLVWQFVLVVVLVAREQRTVRWRVVREALWLRPPSDRTGRRGGRLWWWTVPFLLGAAIRPLIPFGPSAPSDRDFGAVMESSSGQDLIRGNWDLFALIVAMFLFNTVLGEELLFRGLLLPRMRAAFGQADWVANGVLMGAYHLHQPWSIPLSVLASTFLYAYPTRRFRSAWMGIIVHSAGSVFGTVLIFMLVIS